MANIMIADDSDAIRMVLKDFLLLSDHNVIGEARDGQEAIDLCLHLNPDLLLLDLAMPKKDGSTVVKELIAHKTSTKIVLITASDDQRTIQNCLDLGAVSYIAKPFQITAILKTISDVLAK